PRAAPPEFSGIARKPIRLRPGCGAAPERVEDARERAYGGGGSSQLERIGLRPARAAVGNGVTAWSARRVPSSVGDPEYEAQHQAQQQARHQREIERPVVPLDDDIAG